MGTTGQSADNLQITYKPFHSHTGFSYKVCFQDMNQINKGTGYRRKIMRRQNPNYVAPIASAEPVMATAVPIEEGMGGLAVSNFGPAAAARGSIFLRLAIHLPEGLRGQ